MSKQIIAFQDGILPIFIGSRNASDFAYDSVTGTAFLIGQRGIAVTASHVVDQI